MTDSNSCFETAIQLIDAANSADPNRTTLDGREWPDELLYSVRMTQWLERLDPNASEALRLAVRSQHLCRWMIPRESYPMDRLGYLRWRTDLGRFHAERAAGLLREAGYDDATVTRVQSLVRKEGLKSDPEAQTLEDVACLVFLEYEFSDFARKHDEAKVVGIVSRTWRKMSERGRGAATGLGYDPEARRLIEQALRQAPVSRPGPGAP